MSRFITFASLALVLLLVGSAFAVDDLRNLRLTEGRELTPQAQDPGKAARDTVYLIGGADLPGTGDFEWASGQDDFGEWGHEDVTAPSINHWAVDTYHMENLNMNGAGNQGAWCGSILFPACPGGDEEGGYGNDWNDGLDYWGDVADPGVNATVTLDFYYNVHTEEGWDWFNINVDRGGTWVQELHVSAVLENIHYSRAITFTPADYVNGNQFHIQLQVTSDGNTSDADCLWPSTGAAQVDDISISGTNGVVTYFEDFEDGELGLWEPTLPIGVGDFTQLWNNLGDEDECNDNFTWQAAFIDDGMVVPGVGPSNCTSWCYGPNGWVVNYTGGQLTEDDHVHNFVYSPPLAWPEGDYDGGQFNWTVMRHGNLVPDVDPGILYQWFVKSTAQDDPAFLEVAGWVNDFFVYTGGPDYINTGQNITSYLEAGRKYVQVRLGCYEVGWVWNVEGEDGTPAPYFDNIRVLAYPFLGPGMESRELEIAQDQFPERRDIDWSDLQVNWCRFDAADNIAPQADLWNDAGDSITFDIAPVRADADITEVRMYYKIKPNPLFNGVRAEAPGPNGFIEGFVDADTAVNSAGNPVAGTWAFDMPDTGYFYPGDVMHYFIKATDDTGGNPLSSFMPPDTTGFSDFNTILGYRDQSDEYEWIVHFLPTMFSQTIGDQPKILWWNDFGWRAGQNDWYYALANNGYREGVDFDTYYTNAPTSGVGNGIGRWSAAVLDGYDTILYRCGSAFYSTISNGDPAFDAGNDVGVLDTWLQDGDRNMFLTGDDLGNDLSVSGSATLAFLNNWIGVDHQTQSVLDFIDNQVAPTVRITPSNPVFSSIDEWIAFGGCPGINTFDGVTTTTATRVAEFLNPQGQGGAYPYAAATYNNLAAFNNQIVYMPYDLRYIYTMPGNTGLPARAKVLNDVLLTFNHVGGSPITPVPEAGVFAVKNYPNPFNPQTKIEFTLPQRGQVTVKIFNVRGELVRTLVDDVREGNVAHVEVWNGTDNRGAEVSSGVYFYEVKSAGLTKINKMALVK